MSFILEIDWVQAKSFKMIKEVMDKIKQIREMDWGDSSE